MESMRRAAGRIFVRAVLYARYQAKSNPFRTAEVKGQTTEKHVLGPSSVLCLLSYA
jgi:hypothetical protein